MPRSGPTPRRTRAVPAIAAILLTLAFAAGCGTHKGNGSDQKAMDAIAAQIQTTLTQQPGVTRAEVVYQNNTTAPGNAAVSVGIKPGTDLEAIVDDAVRLVWQSKLNPLHHIRVDIVYDQSDQPGTTRSIDPVKDKAQLEAKYGPRPT